MEAKCDICGKVIPKTNTNTRIIDGRRYVLCGKHYQQYIRFGKIIDSDPNSLIHDNTYDVYDDIVVVHTYKRGTGEETGSFIIDRSDFDLVKRKHWRTWEDNFFTGNFDPISISRFLLGLDHNDKQVVDHINGDRTDNRRSNLRIVYQSQNTMNKDLLSNNTSGITGLSWDKYRNRWAVEIRCDYKRAHLGRYKDISDACYVRYVAEMLLFGEYRSFRNDDVVIPCAINCNRKQELYDYVVNKLSNVGYVFKHPQHYIDPVIASDNQYAERIS